MMISVGSVSIVTDRKGAIVKGSMLCLQVRGVSEDEGNEK